MGKQEQPKKEPTKKDPPPPPKREPYSTCSYCGATGCNGGCQDVQPGDFDG